MNSGGQTPRLVKATLNIADACGLTESDFGVPITAAGLTSGLESGAWKDRCSWRDESFTDEELGRRVFSSKPESDGVQHRAYPKGTPAKYSSATMPSGLLDSTSSWAEGNLGKKALGVMVCGADDLTIALSSIILGWHLSQNMGEGKFVCYEELDGRYRASTSFYGSESRWAIIEEAITSPILIVHRVESAFERAPKSELLTKILSYRQVHLLSTVLSSAVAASKLAAQLRSRSFTTRGDQLRTLLHATLQTGDGKAVPILNIQ